MSQRTIYRFGDFELCPATHEFSRGGVRVGVPVRVFDCLVYLIEHRDRAVGRDELGAAVWGKVDVSEAQLTQTILRARRLLGEGSGEPSCIRTIPRFGYHWSCDVEEGKLDLEPRLGASEPAPESTLEPTEPAPAEAPSERLEPLVPPQIIEPPEAAGAATAGRRWTVWTAIAVTLLLAAGWAATWNRSAPAPVAEPAPIPVAGPVATGILVLPADVRNGAEHAWLRLGAMDVIADHLRAAGLVVVPSETTLALLGAGVQSGLAESGPTELARQLGVSRAVLTRAQRSANGWRVRLQATANDGIEHAVTAESDDVLIALRSAVDLLLVQLGMEAPSRRIVDPELDQTVQRVRAAMLEGDLQASMRILDTAPSPMAALPELQFQRATLSYRAGRLEDAEHGFRRLLIDEAAADPRLRSRLYFSLGAIAMMRDRPAEAEREFQAALLGLDRSVQHLEYGQALGGRGGARFAMGQVQAGLDDLGQARVLLERSGDRLALARMNLAYGGAQLLRDRPREAVDLLEEALAQLEPFAAINERLHGFSAVFNARVALLDYERAAEASASAWVLLPRVADPLNRSEALIDRMQLLLLRGRLTEADQLLAELDGLDLGLHTRLDGRRDSLHARLAGYRGQTEAVLARASAAVTKLAAAEPEAAADALLLRQRALLSLQRTDEATAALRSAPASLSVGLDGRMPLGMRLARAELAVHSDDIATADLEFSAAAADVEARVVPAQGLQLAIPWLDHLLQQERVAAATALIGRLPDAAQADFEGALLMARYHHALGHAQHWSEFLWRARALAGERALPIDLQSAPQSTGT